MGVVEVGRRANTAFLNLVHGQTNYNQKVFLSYQPTEADLGTYIEQFKTNDAALYSCVLHGACQKFVPERSTAGQQTGASSTRGYSSRNRHRKHHTCDGAFPETCHWCPTPARRQSSFTRNGEGIGGLARSSFQAASRGRSVHSSASRIREALRYPRRRSQKKSSILSLRMRATLSHPAGSFRAPK